MTWKEKRSAGLKVASDIILSLMLFRYRNQYPKQFSDASFNKLLDLYLKHPGA